MPRTSTRSNSRVSRVVESQRTPAVQIPDSVAELLTYIEVGQSERVSSPMYIPVNLPHASDFATGGCVASDRIYSTSVRAAELNPSPQTGSGNTTIASDSLDIAESVPTESCDPVQAVGNRLVASPVEVAEGRNAYKKCVENIGQARLLYKMLLAQHCEEYLKQFKNRNITNSLIRIITAELEGLLLSTPYVAKIYAPVSRGEIILELVSR